VAHFILIIPPLTDTSEEFHTFRPRTPENQTKYPYVKISPSGGKPPAATTVRALVDEFVEDLRPKIKDFLSRSQIPIWHPPEGVDEETQTFYRNLAIPAIRNNRPSLLLHHLRGRSDLNPNIDNLFNTEDEHR
jgi:hypothetical protein